MTDTIATTPARRPQPRHPNTTYVCTHCGADIRMADVTRYTRAGFAVGMIACPECGEHHITPRADIIDIISSDIAHILITSDMIAAGTIDAADGYVDMLPWLDRTRRYATYAPRAAAAAAAAAIAKADAAAAAAAADAAADAAAAATAAAK